MRRKARVIHPANAGMGIKEPGQRKSVLGVLPHPQRERLKALEEQERVEGTEDKPEDSVEVGVEL